MSRVSRMGADGGSRSYHRVIRPVQCVLAASNRRRTAGENLRARIAEPLAVTTSRATKGTLAYESRSRESRGDEKPSTSRCIAYAGTRDQINHPQWTVVSEARTQSSRLVREGDAQNDPRGPWGARVRGLIQAQSRDRRRARQKRAGSNGDWSGVEPIRPRVLLTMIRVPPKEVVACLAI
jgi:hypothetical protein